MHLIKVAISALLVGWATVIPVSHGLQQCSREHLYECHDEIENNMKNSCHNSEGKDLDRRSRAGSERQPLARGLLKVISAFNPHTSMSERYMKEESQNVTVSTLFKYGAMGGISYTLGFLTIIALIGITIQACCWTCIGHAWRWKHPRERSRTKKVTVISLFAVFAFLYLLFFCGAVYYSSWVGPDVRSAGCTLNKVVDTGLFHETKTKKKGTFPGMITIRNQASITSQALSHDFAANNGNEIPQHIAFVKRALAAAFAPIVFTDSVLRQRDLLASGVDATPNLKFGLSHMKSFTEKLNEVYGPILDAFDTVPELQTSDAKALPSIRKVGAGLKTLTKDVDTFVDKGKEPYNKFIEKFNRFDNWLSTGGSATKSVSAVILLISCLSIIWLILGSIIFAYYLNTRQYENPIHRKEEKRIMTHLAGFLTFAGIVWSILLFMVAAALMILVYPLADGCSFLKYTLTDKTAFTKYPKIGNGLNTTYVNICLYGDDGGRLSAVHKDLTPVEVDQIQNLKIPVDKLNSINAEIDTTALKGLLDNTEVMAKVYVLPIRSFANDHLTEWLFTPDTSFEEIKCDSTSTDDPCEAIFSQNEPGANKPTKIRGIPSLVHELQNITKKSLGSVCVTANLGTTPPKEKTVEKAEWDYHCSEAKELSTSVSACSTLDEGCYGKLDKFKNLLETMSTINPTIPEYTGVIEALKTDHQDYSSRVQMARRMLDLRRSLQRDHSHSTQPKLPESTDIYGWPHVPYSDPCPIGEACHMYFKLRNRQSISDGYDLVDYDTWKDSWLADSKAAVEQLSDVKKVIQHVSSFATKQTTLSAYTAAGRQILAGDQCYALSDELMEVDKKVCDDVAGNMAGLGFMWFFMAIFCLVGSIMALMYWSSRRKYIDWEAIRRERERQRKYAECLQAAEVGDLARMERAMDEFQPGEVRDKDGNTPLHLAAKHGHPACVNKLVESGYDVNDLNYRGSSPLMEAAGNPHAPFVGRAAVVNKLSDNGSDLNGFSESGNTPLMMAARNRDAEMAQLLVQKGADPNVRDAYNLTALLIARNNGDRRTLDALNNQSGGGGQTTGTNLTNYGAAPPMDHSPPMSATPPAVNEELWTNRKSVEDRMEE